MAERWRPVVAPTEFLSRQAKQSADTSHNQNSVKQKQTREAAVCHVEATTGCPYGIHFYLSKSKRFVNN